MLDASWVVAGGAGAGAGANTWLPAMLLVLGPARPSEAMRAFGGLPGGVDEATTVGDKH